MKNLNYRLKTIITIMPVLITILFSYIRRYNEIKEYCIYIISMMIIQLIIHILCKKLEKKNVQSIGFIVAYYIETAITSITLFFIPCSVVWTVLPFMYICEAKVKDNIEEFYMTNYQKLIMFIIAMVTYIIRRGLINIFSIKYSAILDIVIFLNLLTIMYIVYRNISDDKEYLSYVIDQSKDDSNRDGLTKLYNKAALNQKLNTSIKNIGGVCVIMMDIDNFKKVNDTYGHVFGDVVLKNLGQILSSIVTQRITAYRYGGEEFTIICTSTSLEDAFTIAQDVRKKFNDIKYPLDEEEKCFSLSLGIAHANYGQYESGEELIKNSDTALYEAKHTGKNKVVIYSELEK